MRLISTLLCSLFIFVSAVLVYGWQSEVKTAKSNSSPIKAEELFQNALNGVTRQKPEVVFREFDEAVALWKIAGETDRAAQASLQLGKSFLDEKKFLNALRLLKQAVEFKPSPSPVASISYESIGRVYADLHQHDLALYYYDKALTSTSHTKDDLTRAKIICDQATLYFKFKEIDQADDYLRQASGLNHNLGDKNVEATVRYLSGLIAMNKGHTDESRESLKMALALSKDLADVPRQIEALCALSELSLQLNQVETASDWARQASGLSEGLSQHSNPEHVKRRTKEVAWYSYLTLALVQKAAGINSEAQHSYFFAIGGIELLYLSTYVSTDNSAMSFGENRQLPFDGSIELYMGDGKYSDAFFISEQYRARSLLGLLRTDDTAATTAAKNPDPEIQRLSGSLAQLRTELYSSGVRDKRRTELRGETGQAAFALAEARLASEMDHFRDKVTWKDVVSIPVMQKQLGDDNNLKNTSVLEFFLGKEHSFAWLISSNEVFTAELPARNVVEDQVNEYLKLIASPPNSLYLKQGLVKEKDSGQKLFSSLLGPLASHLTPGKNLIIIPDGVLYGVPFEALVHNDHHLIEDHAISYLPSATLIGLLHEPNRKQADDRMELLAFGDPDFGPWSHGVPPKSIKPKLSDVFRGGASLRGFEPSPLPRTKDEVQYIANRFPKDRVRAYLGMGSTEDTLKRENLRRYKRLHFATHGLIDDANPGQSSLLMTLDNDPGEDGFLEVSEIMDLDLDCDLVVLSACQTARGKLFSGEGIVGLSRAFLFAGARSVAVSLWNVGDISTGKLMKDFYSKMGPTTSNAAALRDAKLEMLHGDLKWRHPYYWAPFILVGKY